MPCWSGKSHADDLSPQCYTALGKALHRGQWLPDLEEHATDFGTNITWRKGNEWSDAIVNCYLQDFPSDPDGPYAEALYMAGLRAEDDEDDVGDSGEESK